MASPVSTLAGKHDNDKEQQKPITAKHHPLIDVSWETNDSTSLDDTTKPAAEELKKALGRLDHFCESCMLTLGHRFVCSHDHPQLRLDMLEGLADTLSTIVDSIRALAATDGSAHPFLEVLGDRGRSMADLRAAAAQAKDTAEAEQGKLEAVQSLDLEGQEVHGAHAKGKGIKQFLASLHLT